ncbi:hypothetical protein Tco_0838651 [Tanacetum coccineum]|uniref:Uncharacterized protein n=1 Tax=Tanacetum coccineum TaxID=301880 RepID=A0ABQ5AQ67_9ASTR
MFVSHIFVLSRTDDNESTESSIPCIILTDSDAEDATLPAAPALPSPNYVMDSPNHTLDFNSDSEPFEEDPEEADPKASVGATLTRMSFMF